MNTILKLVENMNAQVFSRLEAVIKDFNKSDAILLADPFYIKGNENAVLIMFCGYPVYDSENSTLDTTGNIEEQIRGFIAHELLNLKQVLDAALAVI
jgi:hypothetical protein